MCPENEGSPAPEVTSTPAAEGAVEETTEEVETAEAAPEAALTPKEEKVLAKQLKKFKMKVDGEEFEEEIDLNDEEGLTKRFQLGKASQKKMQESAEIRKAAEQFIETLRTNPRKVLTDPNIGVDLKALAREIINEEIENSNKTPEQLETERLKKELTEIQERYKKDEETRKANEFERLQAEQSQKIESGIEEALKTSDLPKTSYTVRKMAEMMMIALQNDIDLSPKDLVPLLRKQMQSDIKDLFAASGDEVLEEFIGKDRISNMRKKKLAKVNQQQIAQTANSVKPTGSAPKKEEAPVKKQTIRDFLKV